MTRVWISLVVVALITLPASAGLGLKGRLAKLNPFIFGDEVFVQDKVAVELLHDEGSPVKLLSAEVTDKGTSLLKMKGLEQSFTTKVENNSTRKVLAYQLVWERHLPFEEYAEQDFRINSASSLKAGAKDTLEFKRPIHYRNDAFYKVFIAKVLFSDETVWKSPRDFDVGGYWADIKRQIENVETTKAIEALE